MSGESDGPWLIVGLGNPGPTYSGNRHNVGFMVVDVLAGRAGQGSAAFRTHRAGASVHEGRLGTVRVVLAKPHTYMNLSGGPVSGLAAYFRIQPERLLVVHDELDIAYGRIRLKRGGGDAGHNGLKSVTRSLSTPDYVRTRVGIGRPPGRQAPADFVLSDFTKDERRELGVLLGEAADAVEAVVFTGLEAAQQKLHS